MIVLALYEINHTNYCFFFKVKRKVTLKSKPTELMTESLSSTKNHMSWSLNFGWNIYEDRTQLNSNSPNLNYFCSFLFSVCCFVKYFCRDRSDSFLQRGSRSSAISKPMETNKKLTVQSLETLFFASIDEAFNSDFWFFFFALLPVSFANHLYQRYHKSHASDSANYQCLNFKPSVKMVLL